MPGSGRSDAASRFSRVSRRIIVEITMEQMECFACNCLEVRNWKFFPALVMSTRAYRSLREDQLEVLREHFDGIYHVDLTTPCLSTM